MKKIDIESQATRFPFRPFSIATNNGAFIEVESASDIFLPPKRTDMMVVFDKSGRMWILDLDHISALEVR
jgi:hypothetical protein